MTITVIGVIAHLWILAQVLWMTQELDRNRRSAQ